MNYDVNMNGYWFSKEQLDEHDKRIRTDAIDECIKAVNDYCGGLPNPRIISCLEQLKEQK